MRWHFSKLGGALYLSAAAAAQAEEYPNALMEQGKATSLQPLSPWHLDFADEKCRLSRLFGETGIPNILFFEQSMPSQVFSMTLAGPDIEPHSKYAPVSMGMRRDKPMADVRPIPGLVGSFGNSYFFGQVSIEGDRARGKARKREKTARVSAGISLEDARTIDRLVVRKVDYVISFETGNMEAPFRALNTCTLDLLQRRGLNADQHTDYVPPALPNEGLVIQRLQHQYAQHKESSGDFALLRVQLTIEPDGSASACYFTYVAYSGSHRPDPCEHMRKLRFKPALDADGKTMRSFYATDIELDPYSPWAARAHG